MVKVTILDKDANLKPEMSAKVTFIEAARATATWKSLWVSTPRVIPAASVGMHRMFFLPSG